jgi:hypothetical protein
MRGALAGGTAIEGITAALLVGLGSSADVETGCLGVGSIVEFSRSDPDVNALNDAAGVAVVAAFAERVREGMATGEFDPALDAEAAARMLLTLRSGLKVSARGGASQAELDDIASLGLQALTRRKA